MVYELETRFEALAGTDTKLALVYDAGQDSKANRPKVAPSGLHFVGSLPPPCDHPELLSVKWSLTGSLMGPPLVGEHTLRPRRIYSRPSTAWCHTLKETR